ncbi:hypothetical protein SVAN01_09149 [Stagonosporopsis vannaccii]|nr:hypothetical protein SVAN01_09149 [Stagonosporopsis vannaccii]
MSRPSDSAASPLLGAAKTDRSPKPIPAGSLWAIRAISYLRLGVGAVSLVAPQFACTLFKYNVPVGSALLVRMVGARDGVLGGLLLTAGDESASDGGRKEIRRAIWTAMVSDFIDVGSLVLGIAMGQVDESVGIPFSAGAVICVGLGAWVLRNL